MLYPFPFEKVKDAIESSEVHKRIGRVVKVVGLTIEAVGLKVFVGEVCDIYVKHQKEPIKAEVVGFNEDKVLLMALGALSGIGPDSIVVATKAPFTVTVSDDLVGKILDGLGRPIEDFEYKGVQKSIDNDPPNPLKRKRIDTILPTGVKAIDGFLTIGEGQRVGIFAGSGVGKSTLLGMISKYGDADIKLSV